jgi:hypothetical protein
MTRPDQKPDLASAMYPSLSREAKVKAAQEAKAREELRERNRRLAADRHAISQHIDAWRERRR